MTREVVIVDALRTPIGRYGGVFKDVRADDLAAHVIKELLKRNPQVNPEEIEDVLMGCANQAGEDNRNVARMAVLLAGLPVKVAGGTVNRLCGSGMMAVNDAVNAIHYAFVVCGCAVRFNFGNAHGAAEFFGKVVGHAAVAPSMRSLAG